MCVLVDGNVFLPCTIDAVWHEAMTWHLVLCVSLYTVAHTHTHTHYLRVVRHSRLLLPTCESIWKRSQTPCLEVVQHTGSVHGAVNQQSCNDVIEAHCYRADKGSD